MASMPWLSHLYAREPESSDPAIEPSLFEGADPLLPSGEAEGSWSPAPAPTLIEGADTLLPSGEAEGSWSPAPAPTPSSPAPAPTSWAESSWAESPRAESMQRAMLSENPMLAEHAKTVQPGAVQPFVLQPIAVSAPSVATGAAQPPVPQRAKIAKGPIIRKLIWQNKRICAIAVIAAWPTGAAALQSLERKPSPYHPPTFDARLTDMVAFVEKETGKPFKHAITTHFVEGSKFDSLTILNQQGEMWKTGETSYLRCAVSGGQLGSCDNIEPVSSPSPSAMFLRFVGVRVPLGTGGGGSGFRALPAATNGVRRSYAAPSKHDIAGFYDSETDVMYVRGSDVGAVQQTVAHELVHAWQDQQGLLDRSGNGADAESLDLGLLEGHAELVANRYMASRSASEKQLVEQGDEGSAEQWLATEEGVAATRSPEEGATRVSMLQVNAWPYVAGPTYLASKSPADVAKLLKKSPTSTWSLMRPGADDTGRGVKVKKPKVPSSTAYTPEGVRIGPLYWSVGLLSVTGESSATQFVDLWAGDSGVVYQGTPGQGRYSVCLVDRVRFIHEQGAQAGRALLQNWAAKQPHQAWVVPHGTTEADVTVCV